MKKKVMKVWLSEEVDNALNKLQSIKTIENGGKKITKADTLTSFLEENLIPKVA